MVAFLGMRPTVSTNVNATEAEDLKSHHNPNQQPLKKGWIRRFRRWATRAVLCVGCVVLLAFGVLFFRMDFPNEVHLLGKTWDTSVLARLQGNHIVPDGCSQVSSNPKIIGHRGSGLMSDFDPELSIGNTEQAIQAAIKANVNWIEIDIRMTKDNVLVVFHDRTLGARTDCPPEMAGKGVCDVAWSDLVSLRLKNGSAEKLLKLEDVFEKFSNQDLKWILDIKPERNEELDLIKKEKLLPFIRDLGPERAILFGNYAVLERYRRPDGTTAGDLSEHDCGLLLHVRDSIGTFLFRRERVHAQCRELKVKYLVIPGMFAEHSFISRLRDEGLDVLVWDCENSIDQKNFVARGVAGLIVDKPAETTANLER